MSVETMAVEAPVAAPAPAVTMITPAQVARNEEVRVAHVPVEPGEYSRMVEKAKNFDRIQADLNAKAEATRAAELESLKLRGEAEKAIQHIQNENANRQAAAQRESEQRILDMQASYRKQQEDWATAQAAKDSALRDTESRAQKFAKSGELARALASQNLVEGSAEELAAVLGPKLEVQPDGDSYAVRTSGGQTAAELVAHYLTTHKHHVRAGTTQGGTANGASSAAVSPTQAPQATPEAPKNMGQAVIQYMQNIQRKQGDPLENMGLPMGLKATR